jgi:hypothetical protein
MRQEIKNAIKNAGYSIDARNNLIADFEVGGYIQYYEEYENLINLIDSGYVNQMRLNGNKVTNNFEQASISLERDSSKNPISIAQNAGRDIFSHGIADYSWHTHLNVFFDEVGRKTSYQEMGLNSLMNNTKIVGKDFFSGERASKPSEADIGNIGTHAKTGILIDMVGEVHFYNKNTSIKIPESIFFR